jgi:hypothetical protein
MGLWKKFLTTIGDTQYFGWKHPLWFSIAPPGYKLKGEHYRLVKPLLKAGDILLQRYEAWIDKWFIPGFWNHAAIYVGNTEEQVIHAVSDGVLIEDIINFMRTDHMIILRLDDEPRAQMAIERAQSIIGAEYDFSFNFKDNTQFSCTEVVDYCYPGLFVQARRLGRYMLAPDDIATSAALRTIWDSRTFRMQWTDNCPITTLSVEKTNSRVKTRTLLRIG